MNPNVVTAMCVYQYKNTDPSPFTFLTQSCRPQNLKMHPVREEIYKFLEGRFTVICQDGNKPNQVVTKIIKNSTQDKEENMPHATQLLEAVATQLYKTYYFHPHRAQQQYQQQNQMQLPQRIQKRPNDNENSSLQNNDMCVHREKKLRPLSENIKKRLNEESNFIENGTIYSKKIKWQQPQNDQIHNLFNNHIP